MPFVQLEPDKSVFLRSPLSLCPLAVVLARLVGWTGRCKKTVK